MLKFPPASVADSALLTSIIYSNKQQDKSKRVWDSANPGEMSDGSADSPACRDGTKLSV